MAYRSDRPPSTRTIDPAWKQARIRVGCLVLAALVVGAGLTLLAQGLPRAPAPLPPTRGFSAPNPSPRLRVRDPLWTSASPVLAEGSAPTTATVSGPYALTSHAPIVITGNKGFTSANGVTGGAGSATNPYLIEGWLINTSSGVPGITINATTAHVVVRNDAVQSVGGFCGGISLNVVQNVSIDSITINPGQLGVQIDSSTDVAVTNSTIYTEWSFGSPDVGVHNSTRVTVERNSLSGGGSGVSVSLGQDVAVVGNQISNGYNGVGVSESSSVRSRVANNTIAYGIAGLSFASCQDGVASGNLVNGTGIGLSSVTNFTLEGNTVRSSNQWAVSSGGSANLTIVSNLFEGNYGGMDWFGTNTGIVTHNRFYNNTVQTWDQLTTPWDAGYPIGGNWWSDYVGVDHCRGPGQDICGAGDGIGDTPYEVSTANGLVVMDRYPLMIPGLPIQVSVTATPNTVAIGQPVVFAAVVEDPEGFVTSYSWDFGDGTTGIGANASHAYAASNFYEIGVTVTDSRSMDAGATVRIEVLPPAALVLVKHPSGFQILVPAAWETHTDYTISGSTVPVASLGPVEGGFRTNVLVGDQSDPTAQETAAYLDGLANETLAGTQKSHPDAYFAEAPIDLTLSGHAAVAFTIGYTSQTFVQRGVLVVSAAHDRDWFILLSVASSAYAPENATFSQMLAGFQITALPTTAATALLVAVAGGIVAAVIAVIVLVARRRRRTQAAFFAVPPPPVVQAAGGGSFCVTCGHPIEAGGKFCGSCGAPVSPGGPPGP